MRGVVETETKRSMWNGKPYRSKSMKEAAKKTARKDDDGAYRSGVDVLYHPVPREGRE